MASIATLAVQLTARTAQFRKKMRGSRRAVSGLSMGVKAAAARMGLFNLKALAAGASVGGLALLTRNAMKNIDAMAKVSDKLGLSTEALGGLRHAAEQTGVPIQQLDMGIQRMTRRIAEASKGMGESKAAIKELGLDAKKLAQLTVDQQFSRIAEAMKDVTSQSDKVRLGFKLFDSEGVALISTLALGADGLAAMQLEAEQLGIALSRVEARKIEQANDEINKLKGLLTGIVSKFAIELAPFIAKASFDITEWGKDGTNAANVITKSINGVIGAVSKLGDTWDFISKGILQSQRAILQGMQGTINTLLTIEQTSRNIINRNQKMIASRTKTGLARRTTLGAGLGFLATGPIGALQGAIGGVLAPFTKLQSLLKKPLFPKVDFGEVEALQLDLDELTTMIDALEQKIPFSQRIVDWTDRARNQFNGVGDSIKGVIDELTALDKKVGDAKQVRFSRFAIRDISSDALALVKNKLGRSQQTEQLVKDPQLQMTNQLLGSMVTQMRGFGLA